MKKRTLLLTNTEVLTALDWKEGDTIHFAASNQTLVCRKMSAKARETAKLAAPLMARHHHILAALDGD